jgi:uncharacterized protein
MELYNKIMSDLQKLLKGDAEQRNILKVIVGEFQRQAKPIASDDDVIKILKKFRNNELETLKLQGLEGSLFLTTIESYLPSEATEEEIIAWIGGNIDFGKYKSKMQAMGDILKHFAGRTDGKIVKDILARL